MMTAPPDDGALLTVTEAAKVLRISRALAYQMVAKGELPSVRIGNRLVRVPHARLLRWIEDRSR